MSPTTRVLYLRIALIVFGLVFIFGVYPLTVVWPSGWSWGHGHDPGERGHLLGDVPALFLIAIILGGLMQAGSSERATAAAA